MKRLKCIPFSIHSSGKLNMIKSEEALHLFLNGLIIS